LCKSKFFYIQSFELYGGEAGFYDFGPLGATLKSNVENLWKQHFVIEEDMLEVSCVSVTPENVLKTSVSLRIYF
jgi:glycyl-tRNA synthetase